MFRITIILSLLLLLATNNSVAQDIEPEYFSQSYYRKPKGPAIEDSKKNSNEIEFIFSGLYLFYKYTFSSQDNNKCAFHPSCSDFGLLAVKKYGAIKGMLATLDRLQRCNGFSPELYEVDMERRVLIDEP